MTSLNGVPLSLGPIPSDRLKHTDVNKYSNMTICAETSFSSMHTQLSCNNRTALPFCVHISSLGFSGNVAVLFLFIFDWILNIN